MINKTDDPIQDLHYRIDELTKQFETYKVEQTRLNEYLSKFTHAVNYLISLKLPNIISQDNWYEGITGWYDREMFNQEQDRKLKYKINELQKAGYTVTKIETK